MKKLIGFLCFMLASLNSNARVLATKISELNFYKFNINREYLKELDIQKKTIFIQHNEFNEIIDLEIYNNEDFSEAKIDRDVGG